MNAEIVLEDKTVLRGNSFGADASVAGEVVFNTGMVGYPESLTDPSYRGQILVLTYPLIGNYGVPDDSQQNHLPQYFESNKIQAAGLIVADYSRKHNHWQSSRSLAEWLQQQNIPAVTGIDTRALTKKLREKGVMLGKIVNGKDVPFDNPNKRNLVAEVSEEKALFNPRGKKAVLLIDCGAKHNIVRSLVARGAKVIRVPWNYDFSKEKFDGILLSNGPGNPKMCQETVTHVQQAMSQEKPILGICLGNQVLALAAGGDTYKLKYGHRSQNQPCIEMGTKRCYITTQNHGYAVNSRKMPKRWEEWFVNANDGTNEGIKHRSKPWRSVQFHPEATPGPVDTGFIFDNFLEGI